MSKAIFDELSHKKLLVFTGKGGTGKSVISTAFAIHLAKSGKKVWLIELGRKKDQHFSRLHELLGCEPLAHQEKEMKIKNSKGTLWASRIDPTESLAEYVGMKIPGGALAGILLNNRVTSSFLEIIPGLPDLVALGKIWYHLTSSKADFKPDIIVIDGPASGHGVALLKAPSNFSRLTKQGPVYKDSTEMQAFLTDPQQTAILFTSLAEEMSLQESWEHHEFLQNFSCPLLLINKVFPEPLNCEEKNQPAIQAAQEYSKHRFQREKVALIAFQKEHKKWPQFPIELQLTNNKVELVKKIAEKFNE